MINKILVFNIVAILFSACVDINLKSELPKIDYYKLDVINVEPRTCEAYELIALAGIEIPEEYKNNKILYIEHNKANYFNQASFISSIKQSLESAIIKESHKHCLKIILPPFSGLNIESFLSLRLLDFYVIKDENKAILNMLYQLSSKGNIKQSGIISTSKDLSSFSNEDSINALQDAMIDAVRELTNNIIPK